MFNSPRSFHLFLALTLIVLGTACAPQASPSNPTPEGMVLEPTAAAMVMPTMTPEAMLASPTAVAMVEPTMPTDAMAAPTATESAPSAMLPEPTALPPTAAPTATLASQPSQQAAVSFEWQELATTAVPPARFDHALAFDSDQQRLVLFGGRGGGQTFGDTWIYDLATNAWREVQAPGPSARFGLASVYDPNSKAVYLFGGQKDAFYNDTWKFDTVTETWSEVVTVGDKPDIRYGHGVTLDRQNNRLVISHGFAADGRHDDTWGLDLGTNQWTNLTPAGDKPLNRCLHDIAYAPFSNSVYLFGGCSSGFGPCPQGDLWSFDLAAGTWKQVGTSGETPSPRQNPSIVVDETTNRVILFGGQASAALNDAWVYDPAADAWTMIHSAGPTARKSHDAVFDAVNNRVYLFGGSTAEGAANDLWMLQL